jgi:hypothetical protein
MSIVKYQMPVLLLLGLMMGDWAAAADRGAVKVGEVLFATDFEGPDALKAWSGAARTAPGYPGGQAIVVERAAGASGSATVQVRLPVEKVRGCLLHFSAMIRAEDVSAKPRPWNGVKFMAPITGPDGRSWPAATLPAGTFDWQRIAFPVFVPDDAQSITLVLGLEAVTGRAWFDQVKVTVRRMPVTVKPRPAAGPMYKGHDLPRLRGAMVGSRIDEESLRVFGREWKANLIRWQIIRHRFKEDPLDLDAYQRWLDGELERLDQVLPWCEKYGLYVVVDLHSPPGGKATSAGYAGSDHGLFASAACQRKFIEVWQQMARRYQHARAVWGYDLANEPVEGAVGDDLADWQGLALRAARAVRAIDARRTIIVEPAETGSPGGFRHLLPIDVPNVVYSVHMYVPGGFTHQGVHGPAKPVRYPGPCDGRQWDKAQLELALKPVIDFQKAYNVHIYVGEFSAIRWAPDHSACRYLKDLIEIFEAHGWDWSYHAFREWQGWSVEHGDDPKNTRPTVEPTDRQILLRGWFSRNQTPRW